jgi:hypothetical protein
VLTSYSVDSSKPFSTLMPSCVAFLPIQVPPVMRPARGDAGVLDQTTARHVGLKFLLKSLNSALELLCSEPTLLPSLGSVLFYFHSFSFILSVKLCYYLANSQVITFELLHFHSPAYPSSHQSLKVGMNSASKGPCFLSFHSDKDHLCSSM